MWHGAAGAGEAVHVAVACVVVGAVHAKHVGHVAGESGAADAIDVGRAEPAADDGAVLVDAAAAHHFDLAWDSQ